MAPINGEYWPARQLVQMVDDTAPTVPAKLPALQLRHTSELVAAIVDEYCPAMHVVHVTAFAADHDPAMHEMHVPEPAVDHDPPSHDVHVFTLAPEYVEYVPATQFRHTEADEAPMMVDQVPE